MDRRNSARVHVIIVSGRTLSVFHSGPSLSAVPDPPSAILGPKLHALSDLQVRDSDLLQDVRCLKEGLLLLFHGFDAFT